MEIRKNENKMMKKTEDAFARLRNFTPSQLHTIDSFVRKRMVDMVIAAAFILLALVFAERPKVILYERPSTSPKSAVPATSAVVTPVPEGNKSVSDPSDFTSDEFRIQDKDVSKLCGAIKADHYKLGAINAPPNSVEWLNAVLQVGDLFDKITDEKPDLVLTAWIRKLKEQTEDGRTKPFKGLKDDEQKKIKRLNRLIVELAYPKEAPVSRSLEVRNIFELDGNYAPPPELIIIPEKPYNLIAVLAGKEKRAIMRDYTGRVVSLKIGDKMIDESVVTDIDRLSVTAKKGKKKKEYRIFEVKKKK